MGSTPVGTANHAKRLYRLPATVVTVGSITKSGEAYSSPLCDVIVLQLGADTAGLSTMRIHRFSWFVFSCCRNPFRRVATAPEKRPNERCFSLVSNVAVTQSTGKLYSKVIAKCASDTLIRPPSSRTIWGRFRRCQIKTRERQRRL